MPFEAAKAMAATFCYNIRFALLPLFGPTFASSCLKPGSELFGHMIVDQKIIERCAQESRHYREIELREGSQPNTNADSESRSATTSSWPSSSMAGNARSVYVNNNSNQSCRAYLSSPPTNNWRAANIPESEDRSFKLPSPHEILANASLTKGYDASIYSPESSESEISPKTSPKSRPWYPNSGHDRMKSSISPQISSNSIIPRKNYVSPLLPTRETRAAYVLMQLHLADTNFKNADPSVKKRRASS
jgi:hypothetical protein